MCKSLSQSSGLKLISETKKELDLFRERLPEPAALPMAGVRCVLGRR